MKANSAEVVSCVVVTKYQAGTVALDNLTLSIESGMCFGLMGENGAGKSTLVKLLMGFIFPMKGQLSVLGETEVRRAHVEEDVPYFYGTSNWDLSAITVLRAAILVLQATSARTYVLLARLSSRASYSRGLMLAAAALRILLWPISVCYQVSVSGTLSLIGVLGLLLVAVYIIGLALVAAKLLECRELLLH